jgi:hypothetical protein
MHSVGGWAKPAARRVLVPSVLFASTALLSIPGSALSAGTESPSVVRTDLHSPAVAVVELFTSMACPSCPAAEAQLKEIAARAQKSGQPIYSLAFHVDYWNPPGHKDPLSKDAFAQRQKAYAEALGVDGVYTPQMIINGTDQFVGSDREHATHGLATALSRPAKVRVKIKAQRAGNGPIVVDCDVSSAPQGSVLNVAIIERGLVKKSASGLREVKYDNVVRSFDSQAIVKNGKRRVELDAPDSLVDANAAVVAYIQDARTKAVLGAASLDLIPPNPARQVMLDEREP